MSVWYITYSISSKIWTAAKWIWTAVVVVILTGATSQLLAGSTQTVFGSFFADIVNWFHKMDTPQRLTIGIIISLMLLSLAAWVLATGLRSRYGNAATLSPETQEMLEYIKQEKEAVAQRVSAQKRERERSICALSPFARASKQRYSTRRVGSVYKSTSFCRGTARRHLYTSTHCSRCSSL